MADQRGGGVRKKESLNLTDTDEEAVHVLLADQDGRIKESDQHSASRRIRSQQRVSEAFANLEFGRDTNRLDYFKVTALDLHGDDHLAGVSTHGGGTRDRGVVVGRSMEQEGGSDTDTAVAYGGIRIRRGPVRFSTNNGSESVVQRLEQERGNGGGGGRGSCMVEGPRSVEERGGVTAGSRWCWWWSGGPKIKAGRGNCSYAGGGGCGNGGDDGGCHGGVRDGDDEDRR